MATEEQVIAVAPGRAFDPEKLRVSALEHEQDGAPMLVNPWIVLWLLERVGGEWKESAPVTGNGAHSDVST